MTIDNIDTFWDIKEIGCDKLLLIYFSEVIIIYMVQKVWIAPKACRSIWKYKNESSKTCHQLPYGELPDIPSNIQVDIGR